MPHIPTRPTPVTPAMEDVALAAAVQTSSGDPSARETSRRGFSHAAGFWIVAAAFLTAMAFSVVPTPLWTLYQARDGFSTFAVTIAFAAYAVGVLASLFLAGHVSDRLGRRSVLLPAILLEALAAVMFIVWNDLGGLIAARIVSGLGIGLITATATAHILELHGHAHPTRSRARADAVSTAANLGGFAVGALVSGVLAEYVALPLVTPYVVFLVLLLVAALGVVFVPETVVATTEHYAYRPQQIRVPREYRRTYFAAGSIAFSSLALFGLFTSLAPTFIVGDLGVTSRAIAGLVVFVTFAAGAAMQVALTPVPQRTQVVLGVGLMVVGLASIAASVFVSSPALFIGGGVLAGGAAGTLFKSSLSIGSGLAEPRFRGEALAGLFLFGYLGLVVPVVGIGIATLSVPLTVALASFSVVIALIVVIGGSVLLRPAR